MLERSMRLSSIPEEARGNYKRAGNSQIYVDKTEWIVGLFSSILIYIAQKYTTYVKWISSIH
jgi:hypothetical protein